jgi:hypothetical protein
VDWQTLDATASLAHWQRLPSLDRCWTFVRESPLDADCETVVLDAQWETGLVGVSPHRAALRYQAQHHVDALSACRLFNTTQDVCAAYRQEHASHLVNMPSSACAAIVPTPPRRTWSALGHRRRAQFAVTLCR